jgi:hypothetical protein
MSFNIKKVKKPSTKQLRVTAETALARLFRDPWPKPLGKKSFKKLNKAELVVLGTAMVDVKNVSNWVAQHVYRGHIPSKKIAKFAISELQRAKTYVARLPKTWSKQLRTLNTNKQYSNSQRLAGAIAAGWVDATIGGLTAAGVNYVFPIGHLGMLVTVGASVIGFVRGAIRGWRNPGQWWNPISPQLQKQLGTGSPSDPFSASVSASYGITASTGKGSIK